MLWRRSYDTPPPPISDTNQYSQADDPRYAEDFTAAVRPGTLYRMTGLSPTASAMALKWRYCPSCVGLL